MKIPQLEKCYNCDYKTSDPEEMDAHLNHINYCPDPKIPTYNTNRFGLPESFMIFISPSTEIKAANFLDAISVPSNHKRDYYGWLGYKIPGNLFTEVRKILETRFFMSEEKL